MTILRLAASLAATVATWSAACASRRALTRLSRRELADIGLHEGDIEVAALLGAR